MVKRKLLDDPKPKVKKTNGHGGVRAGAGRKKGWKSPGGTSGPVQEQSIEVLARKRAHTSGIPPHELLCHWAQKGYMMCWNKEGPYKVPLTPDQMISAASKAAAHYHPPMKAIAMRMEETQQVRMEVDMTKLAALPTTKLEMMREIIMMFSQMGLDGGSNIVEMLTNDKGDASRFESQIN